MDNKCPRGLQIERELHGSRTQAGQGRCGKLVDFFRSGLPCLSSGYPHPLGDGRDDQVIGSIDGTKTQNTMLLQILDSI